MATQTSFSETNVNYDQPLGLGGVGGGASYHSESYQASSTDGAALGAGLGYAGTGLAGTGLGLVGAGAGLVGTGVGLAGAGYGGSAYESASYTSSTGNLAGDVVGVGGAYGVGAGYGVGAVDLGAANYSTTSQTTAVQRYATDAQGLFQDSNPQIIRRPAPGGNLTYTQNIRVRFLQPPPVPPPGPLIIREVRPPQPPVPPPLRIRQQAPPLPQPPPLVLRERPPVPPAAIASQTVIRNLAALPVPPRSVIIERLPALPARPRDIVIERWVPYGAQAKRRTVVQRAGAAKQYASPRNVIIQYEPAQVRVVRQFQRLGVTQESPAVYVQRYGGSLLDAQVLVQQARAAGVVEDISAPGGVAVSQFAASSGTYGDAGLVGGVAGLGLGGASSYESSSFSTSGYGDAGLVGGVVGAGYGTGLVGGVVGADLGGAASYESSSYSASSDGGAGGFSTFESSSFSSSAGGADVIPGGVVAGAGLGAAVY